MSKGSNVPVPATVLRIDLGRRTGASVPGVDVCALLLSRDGRVRSDDDLVSRHRPAHPSQAVRHEGTRGDPDGTVVDSLLVDLTRLEPAVERVVIAALVDRGTFGQVPGLRAEVREAGSGEVAARFDTMGVTVETALVAGELYRRQGGWKFRAVGQGYDSGFRGLAAAHGLTSVEPRRPAVPEPGATPVTPDVPTPSHAPVLPAATPRAVPPSTPAATTPAVPSAPVRLSKVTLTKARPSVSLAKQGGTSGALRVNLDWQARPRPSGRSHQRGRAAALHPDLDLDLCALFELTDGRKGVIQALGNAFGSLDRPPYIHLDGDDRTGAVETGENLTVNLDRLGEFRRILVFVTIYEGARSFADLHATVTLRPQHGAPVEFFLDECTVPSTVCALALLTRENGDLVVRREARYLVPERGVSPQRTVDRAYGWGLNWTPGRK